MAIRISFRRSIVLTTLFLATGAVCASGDSGTQSLGEMTLTGAQFGLLLGAVAALGAAIWLVVKFASR